MNAILHGTWTSGAEQTTDDLFFVWAERSARVDDGGNGGGPRIRRHPFAATTIEIAELLSTYVPQTDWQTAERLTRVALLPSARSGPRVPLWLASPNGLQRSE